MENGEISNQLSMGEIYGLGSHPEDSLMQVRDILVELFFGPESNLSTEAMRIVAAFFARLEKDLCYVVLDSNQLGELLGDPELRCLKRVIDEFKHCYLKIKSEHNGDPVELEVAAFQLAYRRNKKDMRIKEFVLGCNQLPQVQRLFTYSSQDHFFTGAFNLYIGLKGNTKNVSRAMKFYWYLKRNVVQRKWFISEQRLRVLLGCVDSNKEIKDFVKQVIKPICASITKLADLKVNITPKLAGSEHKTVGFWIECEERPINLKEVKPQESICDTSVFFKTIREMFSDSECDDEKIRSIADEFDEWKEHHKYSDEQALKELSGYIKIARHNAKNKSRVSGYVLSMMLNSTKPDSDKTRKKGNNIRKTGKEVGITVGNVDVNPIDDETEEKKKARLEENSKLFGIDLTVD